MFSNIVSLWGSITCYARSLQNSCRAVVSYMYAHWRVRSLERWTGSFIPNHDSSQHEEYSAVRDELSKLVVINPPCPRA